MSLDVVQARAFANELPNLVRLDQLIAAAEGRRNATLREIERHRRTFGRTLRAVLHDIEETDSETLGANPVARKETVDGSKLDE